MNKEIPEIVKKAHKTLPHFEDGRIDYSNAKKAPVVVAFILHQDEILILKRSREVGTHQKRWGLVAGYLDELKPIMEKGLEEIEEETGIKKNQISSITQKGTYRFKSKDEKIFYISHLILAEIEEKPNIELSWEHTDYKWIKIEKAKKYLSTPAIEELKIVLQNKNFNKKHY